MSELQFFGHIIDNEEVESIDGKRFDWKERDIFCVPSWAWHEHANASASEDACWTPRTPVSRKPVCATMRWSGRTALPSTYQPRWSTSSVRVPFQAFDASTSRSCVACVIDGASVRNGASAKG